MAGTFYFRKNSTTYKLYSVSNSEFESSGTVENFTACSNFLMCYLNTGSSSSAKSYVPALTTQGTKVYAGLNSGGSQVYYDTSSPTIAFRKNGKTYYCAKSMIIESYDIPAGTYSPSTFENLIKSFIAQNGSRTVSNSFSVEVNGQTYSVPAGRAIYYTYQYSGQARFVSFNGSPRGNTGFQSSFYDKGVYCTYWSLSQSQGESYYQYNIKVNTGINFS